MQTTKEIQMELSEQSYLVDVKIRHHICFFTENVNKFNEIKNYLANEQKTTQTPSITISMHKPEYEIYEIQSFDRNEIVRHKLKDIFEKYIDNIHGYMNNDNHDGRFSEKQYWVMVEDTSFCIDREGGFTGPFIKYYLQCQSAINIANRNWASKAQSIVSLGISRVRNNTNTCSPYVFEGITHGLIVSPKGDNGFGFDPIFRPLESDKTNAEMTMDEKGEFNPRIKGFQDIISFLLH